MKRMVLVAGVLFFLWWRHERLHQWDRQHRFGAYAPIRPVSED